MLVLVGFLPVAERRGENRRQFLHSIYELEITNFSLCGIVAMKNEVFSSVFQLLDCFSIPTVLILSCTVLRARYRLTHIGGMALGLMSVVALVWTDVQDGRGGVSAGGKCCACFLYPPQPTLN